MIKKLGLSLAITTTIAIGGVSSQSFAMSPFQADYQFSYNGKNIGSATRTLAKSGNNWSYAFVAKAVGLASATETSKFTLNNGQISSTSFSRTSQVLVHNNTMNINFNSEENLINTQKDDEAYSFSWKVGVLDELNVELQLREDLKKGILKSNYYLADAKEIEARKFVKQGNEKVTTSYGTFDTMKVVLKHDKPGRETIFWLAPKLDYLPVKVTHVDKKTSYGLLLTSYKGQTS
ncbi:DUF3108 domain-containing protein [Acinetobacter faecalis]|uniref:DUF3108 domain-containing protein n=1 Tax=Acinetobacter faecalis TaxID=2665161 RepID=UPI002A916296|nr:DUF3108 domain-containing protein [Acinetobacter faecalis]MDY6524625.1 DUF3108 domain-containing protein [Acinetobacter faecalis]